MKKTTYAVGKNVNLGEKLGECSILEDKWRKNFTGKGSDQLCYTLLKGSVQKGLSIDHWVSNGKVLWSDKRSFSGIIGLKTLLEAGHGGACLYSQHSGSWGRRNKSLKPVWATEWDPVSNENKNIIGEGSKENGRTKKERKREQRKN
jgi:hypothetical protein